MHIGIKFEKYWWTSGHKKVGHFSKICEKRLTIINMVCEKSLKLCEKSLKWPFLENAQGIVPKKNVHQNR